MSSPAERVAMLQAMEEACARRLMHPVARVLSGSPYGPELCTILDDHEQHARELRRLAEALGLGEARVTDAFAAAIERRLLKVTRATSPEEALGALLELEQWATEVYESVLAEGVPEETRESVLRLSAEEHEHSGLLAAPR